MRFKNLSYGISALLLIGFIAFFSGCGGKGHILVSKDKVTKRNVTESVSASGKIQPEVEVKVSSDVSGEIVELYVVEGDSVKKGQLLLEINPDILQSASEAANASFNNMRANLAGARARLEQSKSQLAKTEIDYNRNKTLHDKKAISDAEFQTSKSAYEVAKSELVAATESVNASEYMVENAKASANQAQKNLARTKIYAPNAGTVSKLTVEKGERVVGTAQMSGTELLRVANLTEMQVVVDVNENDIVRLEMGDTAMIEVDAYPNRKFKGIVTQIANSPKTASGVAQISTDEVTNFQVKIRILRSSYIDLLKLGTKSHSPFRPGMSATVDILTNTVKNALTVPIQAVTARLDTTSAKAKETGEEEFKEYVFMVDGEKAKMVEVKTGIQDNKHIVILKGLKEGDEIIDGPYSAISKTLENDKKIMVVSKENLFKEDKNK